MSTLLTQLAGDCRFRDTRRGSADFCGAFFPDLYGPRPPDRPSGPMGPRIVGGRAA